MGCQERRGREIQERKQSIMKCSQKLFEEKGFTGATMDDIAAEADLTKATVYKYFCSKQELLGSLLLTNMRTLIEWFAETDRKHTEPLEKLNAFGEIFIHFMRSEVPNSIGSYLLHLDFNSANMSEALRMELREHLAMLFAQVRKLIDDGVQKKIFKKDFDATRMSLVIWGATIGIQVLSAKLTPHILPDFGEDVFNEVLKLMPTGLLESAGRSNDLG